MYTLEMLSRHLIDCQSKLINEIKQNPNDPNHPYFCEGFSEGMFQIFAVIVQEGIPNPNEFWHSEVGFKLKLRMISFNSRCNAFKKKQLQNISNPQKN